MFISLSAGASSIKMSNPNTVNDRETYSEVDDDELKLSSAPNTHYLNIQDNYMNVD